MELPLTSIRALQLPARLYLLHMVLLTFGLAVNALLFNLAIPALGYSLRLLGLLNSVPTLVAALTTLPLWWLVTRAITLRTALLCSAVLQAAAILTVVVAPPPVYLLLGLSLTGPAGVLFQVSAAPFMMRHSSAAERDMLFSLSAGLNIAFAGLGSLIGGTLPGLLARLLAVPPQSGMDYRATFLLASLCVLASSIPLLFIRPVSPPPPSAARPPAPTTGRFERFRSSVIGPRLRASVRHPLRAIPEPWQSMLRRPWSVLRFMVTPLLISCGAALLIPYLNLYFRQRFALSDEVLGSIFAAVHISTGLATLAAPWLARRLGKMGSVALTQALAVPCLLALGLTPLLSVAVALALVRGTLMNMAFPLYDAYAMEQSAEAERPTVIGLINGAFSLGYIFGPYVSVRVQEQAGFMPLFFVTAGFYTLAAVLNYVLFVRNEQWPERSSVAS